MERASVRDPIYLSIISRPGDSSLTIGNLEIRSRDPFRPGPALDFSPISDPVDGLKEIICESVGCRRLIRTFYGGPTKKLSDGGPRSTTGSIDSAIQRIKAEGTTRIDTGNRRAPIRGCPIREPTCVGTRARIAQRSSNIAAFGHCFCVWWSRCHRGPLFRFPFNLLLFLMLDAHDLVTCGDL